jgi:hypothetical protein
VKKLTIVLLAAFMASGVLADGHEFPDVSVNHWASDAVSRIAAHGIIIGFPDGTFRGNESFTRYQAALVISRTVAILSANSEAANAMTANDIASIRNALQSLASDVSANSVRLAAAESAIATIADAGEVRSNDLASLTLGNAARLDDVEAALHNAENNADDGPSNADIQELQVIGALNQGDIEELREKVASVVSAAASSGDLADLSAEAGARARENAAAVAALNTVVNLLSDNVVALVQAPGPEPVVVDLSGIDNNAGDIGNIREFVITLRRDQVAISERVSALETSDAANAAAITDLQGRVTTLETNLFDISGSLEVFYDVVRLGTDGTAMFDIDRAFGDGFTASGLSTYSTGTHDDDDDGEIDREANEDAEIQGAEAGDVDLNLSVEMGWTQALNGIGSPNGLNAFDGVLDVSIAESPFADDGEGWEIQVESATINALIGDENSLFFNFGEESGLAFGAFGADHIENDGFNFGLRSDSIAGDAELNGYYVTTAADAYAMGLEGRLAPLDGFSGGASISINNTNAAEAGDVDADNVRTLVWGTDGAISVSLLDIAFEYQSASEESGDSLAALYVTTTVDAEALGLVNELSVSYFDIPAGWNAHASSGSELFAENNAGFIVNTGADLLLLDVDAYFTQYSSVQTAPDVEENRAFGASVSADLFSGVSASANFDQAYVDGVLADATTELDAEYTTTFGVGVDHDGSADDALIAGLDLAFAYSQSEEDNSATSLSASADYSLNFGILDIDPYASYARATDSDADADDTTEIKVGASISSDTLDVVMAPSLSGNVNYRTNAHTVTDADGDEYTATELQFSAGLSLNEFLMDNSVLTARYASYSGTNTTVDAGADATITAVSTDADTGEINSTTSGFELVWNYWDLQFLYGQFVFDPDTATAGDATSAQYFTLSYTIEF